MLPDISEYFSWFLYLHIIKPRRTLSTELIQKKDTLITAAICCSSKHPDTLITAPICCSQLTSTVHQCIPLHLTRLASPYLMYIQHGCPKVFIQKNYSPLKATILTSYLSLRSFSNSVSGIASLSARRLRIDSRICCVSSCSSMMISINWITT